MTTEFDRTQERFGLDFPGSAGVVTFEGWRTSMPGGLVAVSLLSLLLLIIMQGALRFALASRLALTGGAPRPR